VHPDGDNASLASSLVDQRRDAGRCLVETASGKVRGLANQGVYFFKGIPYGTDPSGSGRFQAAKPVAWAGVLDASEYGPPAAQVTGWPGPAPHVAWSGDTRLPSENCLVLNVFTANPGDGSRLPVMVYLHGGGFMYGSGGAPGFDGSNLARRGVVLVSVNHRLNLFGHLHLAVDEDGRYANSGNVGLLDIVEALGWVRTNIARFGGDPGNVTIFGQSGGGAKVGVLMAMPMAKGLFHRAIVQSASSMLRMATPEEAERNTYYFLREVGVSRSCLDSLYEIPVGSLLAAMRRAVKAAGGIDNYRPVVDGHLLPAHPFDTAAPACSAPVPLMLGWCETEQRMRFSLVPGEFEQTAHQACTRVAGYLGVRKADAAQLFNVYHSRRPKDTPGDIMALIYGDHRYRRTVTHAAELRSQQNGAPTYMYLVKWKTPVLNGVLRSPHTLCIPFVFANVDIASGMTGTGVDRYRLQDEMSGAWVEFAKSGNPNHEGLPEWQPFSAAERHTMVFDRDTQLVRDPAPEERIALECYPAYAAAETEGGRRY
jgi:para-nitrobenzyl esterase